VLDVKHLDYRLLQWFRFLDVRTRSLLVFKEFQGFFMGFTDWSINVTILKGISQEYYFLQKT